MCEFCAANTTVSPVLERNQQGVMIVNAKIAGTAGKFFFDNDAEVNRTSRCFFKPNKIAFQSSKQFVEMASPVWAHQPSWTSSKLLRRKASLCRQSSKTLRSNAWKTVANFLYSSHFQWAAIKTLSNRETSSLWYFAGNLQTVLFSFTSMISDFQESYLFFAVHVRLRSDSLRYWEGVLSDLKKSLGN